MRVEVVQIPAQTAEDVLARLKEHVELAGAFLVHPVDVALHVPLSVTGAEYGDLRLEQLRERLGPLVRTGGVTQARVEEHEAVQVRIEGLEVLGVVHGVEVVDIGGDLHLAAEAVLGDTAERVGRGALWERELGISVRHALRSDEDEMDQGAREHVRELEPDCTGQGGLGTGAEHENADWWCLQAQALHINVLAGLGRVQGVPEG